MARLLVVRADYGEVRESRLVEGELAEVVRDIVRRVIDEWDPLRSDLIVLKDEREIEVDAPLDDEIVESIRLYGSLSSSEGKITAKIPVVTISFENKMISEERYEEYKVYIITLYLGEEAKSVFEAEAAELTSPVEEPGGIHRVG